MDKLFKAVYIWIVLALVWMGLELLLCTAKSSREQ